MSLIQYRQDIQILRGIAVSLVLFYHLKLSGFGNGLLGVDIFFVVSGYLMARLYDKRSPAEFLLARLNRLLPAYVVVTVATLVAAYVLVVPSDYDQVVEQSAMAAGFLSNLYYWNQSSYFQSGDFNPLLNYWSLAVEVQFYLFVPFLFPLLRRRKSLALGLFVLSLVLCVAVLTKSEKSSFFMLPTRMWEFMLGAFAAWYVATDRAGRGRAPFVGLACLLAVLVLIAVFPLAQGSTDPIFGHPSIAALIVTLLTAGVLAAGLPVGLERSLPGRALTRLGDVSYSVYLVHFPVIVLFNYVPFGGTVLGYSSLAELALLLGATFALAIPLYAYVERSRALRLRRLALVLPVMTALAVVAVGTGTLRMNTLPQDERNIVNALNDHNQRRCPLSFRVLHPTERLCLFGPSNSDRRVALIGDSHSVSLRDQFVSQAAERHIATYFAVHNRPILDKRFPPTGMDAELQDPRLKAVVLHYRVTRLEREGRQENLIAFVQRSLDHDVPVYVIAPVPNYSDLVPRYLYQARKAGQDLDGLQITREQLRQENNAFWDLAGKLPAGVRIFEPADYLCPDETCRYHDDMMRPYYYDNHHLTLTGASVLSPMLDALLESIPETVRTAASH